MARDPDLEVIEAIYDALDRQDAEEAWKLVRAASSREGDGDPVLHFLGGQALLELDQPERAVESLRRAVSGDPEDPEFGIYLAWALFRSCRFDEATERILSVEPPEAPLPELHYVLGLCAERAGRLIEADEHFERASALDAEAFPRSLRLTDEEFARQVDRGREGLAQDFRRHLEQVTVMIEGLPSDALLLEEQRPLDPEHLLGLFAGVPLDEQTSFSPGGELPPRIHLFQRNLERFCSDADELAEQIRVTLYHELGHYLGLGEDELEELGYG